ncbi:hypothetical protein BH780_gp042 [Bacillus phage Eldridge]|uniref:Uncharacterized protein n=1 Tax=Bacillus phage Eldridge TaxID=1776293 RepID=A0A109ZYK8_9CAUD|nr:hypothetical protein BH780_gp042 [Bacillus phage Eldridge]AMB18625.1 hypothetical protein Eldridge_042 [Bacillus phage Eldridge]
MMIKENKYHSTIKSEFKDLVWSLVFEGRTAYHLYTIHRLLNLGLLIDFQFKYCPNKTADQYVHIELDLKEFGRVTFKINTETDYVVIADDLSIRVLEKFLEDFDTGLDDKAKKRSLL